MNLKAGFAEVNITPPIGTKKAGWMKDITGEIVLDPICAKFAVFENGQQKVAFIQLDLLSIRWTQTNDIRKRIQREYKFPGKNIMISTTHNHAGPAIAKLDPVDKDEEYIKSMVKKVVDGFGKALKKMQDIELGFNHTTEFEIAYNRRTVMRDGSTKSQVLFTNPDALYTEGPVDPELGVLVAKNKKGNIIGCLVNFTCHPTHHGGTNEFSAGYPGVINSRMKLNGCPVTLFLNGAYGNIIHFDFHKSKSFTKEEVGKKLVQGIKKAMENMEFSTDWKLGAKSATMQLNYRKITKGEIEGKNYAPQPFRSREFYNQFIEKLKKKIARQKLKPAEVQVIQIGNHFFAGIPAEYFVEHGLRIKTETYPKHALVVGGANGMIGYVPTRKAFKRGGYEVTLGPPSWMAPETGDKLADKAIELIKKFR